MVFCDVFHFVCGHVGLWNDVVFIFFKEHIQLTLNSEDNLVDSRSATEKQGHHEVSKAANSKK